jgi:hypothetical protein
MEQEQARSERLRVETERLQQESRGLRAQQQADAASAAEHAADAHTLLQRALGQDELTCGQLERSKGVVVRMEEVGGLVGWLVGWVVGW